MKVGLGRAYSHSIPIPILPQIRLIRGFPRNSSTPISVSPKRNLSPHIQRQDIRIFLPGTLGYPLHLLDILREIGREEGVILHGEAFYGRPVHGAFFEEKSTVECEGAGDVGGGESAVGKADLGGRAGGGYLEHFGGGWGEGSHVVRL